MKATKKLDISYLMKNADFHDLSADHKWSLWAWKNIVFMKLSGFWSIEESDIYMNRFWAVFLNIRKNWSEVYFLIDTNAMELQTEAFRRYMKENWAHIADREDLLVCLIEKKSMKRLIWKSIHQLLGIASKIELVQNYNQALQWLQKQTYDGIPQEVKTENSRKQTPIEHAQQFIQDQLLSLSKQVNIKIDELVWDQRVNDWQAEIHFLAIYIAGKRFALAFNEVELIQNQDTEDWKRMIVDKINWFLTEEITVTKPQKYKYLDSGKSWIEAELTKILETRKKPLQIVEWRNPDEWRYDIPLGKGSVGLTINTGAKQILLMFTSSDLKACEKSPHVQSKLMKYVEAKFIFEKDS